MNSAQKHKQKLCITFIRGHCRFSDSGAGYGYT